MSRLNDILQSANYNYWVDSQLEPDMRLKHGKMKREPNGIAVLQQAEARIKSDPGWRGKEQEFQAMKGRRYD